MNIQVTQQLIKFIYFIIVGCILGISFDFFRIKRKVIKTSDFFTYLEDIIFGLISGIILIVSIYVLNDGQLRIYILWGILSGVIIYMLALSKYFIKINVKIINNIIKTIKIILKPFIILYNFLKRIILKPISFIFINIRQIIRHILKIRNK